MSGKKSLLAFRKSFLSLLAGAWMLSPVPGVAGLGNGIDLADIPMFSTVSVPGNLALALSVEWPTASTPAYSATTAYSSSKTYLGYFDPARCYHYLYNSSEPSSSYFEPSGSASNHECSSSAKLALWSGNYLNWATTQTLDGFRWVLTGGYRSVDTEEMTVLTKTYNGHNSKNPDKTLSSRVSGATPFKWSSASTRVRGLGTAIYITKDNVSSSNGSLTNTPVAVDYTGQNSYVDSGDTAYADPKNTYKIYVNVRVCVSNKSGDNEGNCKPYGKIAKPEGLLQAYSSKLRYSAFGYYNDSESSPPRDGAVMRARMKFIGPTKPAPGSGVVSNDTAQEWDAKTGIMLTNPDSGDAKSTEDFAKTAGWSVAISNSGVMNYLNKFGYSSKSYKGSDPVSELYYAVTRYFRHLGNVAAYTSLSGADTAAKATKWLDGFPAITSWDDPIAYACQRNFILGIGDVNSHEDANLPSAPMAGTTREGTVPTEVTDDKTVNTGTATEMVGQLEGLAKLSTTSPVPEYKYGNTYYIAGLAYDAHTKDIRSDLAGDQYINTYWMDVLENGYVEKNQYWLAAKYGGFTVPGGFSTYATNNGTKTLSQASWNTSNSTIDGNASYLRPDNYFPGNSPEVMKEGLTKAFEKIASEATSAVSTGLAQPPDPISQSNYKVAYDANTWSSILSGQLLSTNASGDLLAVDIWNATALLDSRGASDRKIVTCCTSSGAALPFTYSSLSAASLATRTRYKTFGGVTGVSSDLQSIENYVNYLRGARNLEVAKGGPYRNRAHLLGDVVNAKLVPVSVPQFPYLEVYNPGYRAFRIAQAHRTTVVYAAANDGMLHAFDGTLPTSAGTSCVSALSSPSSDCGKELFAYIPSFTYGGESDASTLGLASLGNPTSFSHHYLVDATPVYADVDFSKTVGASGSQPDWRTILVGGLGKGGKGVYALDITDPTSWSSETAIAGKVLWEFSHDQIGDANHLGYSYGAPIIVKTPEYGWTIILTSGYNNENGHGYFFFVNPRTGELLRTVDLGEGSAAKPLNMAQAAAYLPDITEGTADALYAGDLQGNVWRIDLTATKVSQTTSGDAAALRYDYSVVKLAALTDSSGNSQPVMTKPQIYPDPNSSKRYVMVGTGRLLADSDISSSQVQTFYSIVDGNAGRGKFYNTTDGISLTKGNTTTTHSGIPLPSGISFPVTRDVLVANSDLLSGIGSEIDAKKPMGWYFDLPKDATSGIASRVDVDPVALATGVVALAANLPNGNVCSPGGTAQLYVLGFAEGLSAQFDSAGNRIASYGVSGSVVSMVPIGRKIATSTSGGKIGESPYTPPWETVFKRLNWREIPTAD